MAARHLLLDLAGVLCEFDSTARLERLGAVSRLETTEVDERLYGSGIVDRCDRGELDAAGIRDVLRDQLELDCDDFELARLWASAFTPDDQVLAVVDSVAPGVTRTLLTNNDALLRDTLPLVLPAVHARIAISLFSATTRATKPSPAAYAAALAVLGAVPADVLFVDDSESNIDGARRMGIATVHFTSAESLRSELASTGLLA
ncbi:MAG: HAD-IA family hydrolase [Actinomycetota bacterium]|nr:HAD-IA family hydrolase [Actinomycetota bacterium]